MYEEGNIRESESVNSNVHHVIRQIGRTKLWQYQVNTELAPLYILQARLSKYVLHIFKGFGFDSRVLDHFYLNKAFE